LSIHRGLSSFHEKSLAERAAITQAKKVLALTEEAMLERLERKEA